MPVLTEPEWLGRKDSPDGRWVVHECEPVRGAPATSVIGKEMHIPTGDNQYERVIRAHEMMHAKVFHLRFLLLRVFTSFQTLKSLSHSTDQSISF